MRYTLPYLFSLLLGATGLAFGQTWQPPNTDLGGLFPKPQMPTFESFQQQQQARTRAYNQAAMDEVERYNARQAAGGGHPGLAGVQSDVDEFQQQLRGQAQFNAEFAARNKRQYEAGYQALAEMLDGRRPKSLPLAVFIVENSYSAGELSFARFQADLDNLVKMGQGLAGANGNRVARFMALQQLMTDTVRVSYAGKVVSQHLPYRYDFTDFWGREDYSKMFVTKLLRTNSGQCHSLPLLYKLLADRLGIAARLSMAPNHSYIQVVGPDGELYSYETTNGHFTTDAFYMTSGYIKTPALKARAYLDTLTLHQTIAYQVTDLALGYAHYYGDDEFTEKCADLALQYYPQSIQARLIRHNAALARFARAYKAAGSPAKEQALQLPTLKPLWAEVGRWTRELAAVGFEEIPPEQYTRWLKSAQAEGQRQAGQQAATNFLHSATH
jgi:hypothetical protein